MKELNFDKSFQKAYDLLDQTKKNLFITGKAGVGKSTLLSYFISKTKKNTVLLAPTGVAALNIKGSTIHSFFKFKPGITIEKARRKAKTLKKTALFKQLDGIIIDEISMVRADLLDCIDIFLKTVLNNDLPFGGIRMIFIGDLYQLPPVVTNDEKAFFENFYTSPYFFSSKIMEEKTFDLQFVELEKVYRQTDEKFIEILNNIRKKTFTNEDIFILNKFVKDDCDCNDDGFIYLTTTNSAADKINIEKLKKIEDEEYLFEATIDGDFNPKIAPTNIQLKIKKNSQIMFLMNHPQGFWVNGTIGVVENVYNDSIEIRLDNGNLVEVEKHEWKLYKYQLDEKANKIKQKSIGSFEQFPIKLAWAITIHKSQGKTFEKVILYLDRASFAHGQTYVGLSRCTSLKNLILKKPLRATDFRLDYRVSHFLTNFQYAKAKEIMSDDEKLKILKEHIKEQTSLKITYLKASDQKSIRTISPKSYKKMSYNNKFFYGLEAFCHEREELRVFKLERILSIENKI